MNALDIIAAVLLSVLQCFGLFLLLFPELRKKIQQVFGVNKLTSHSPPTKDTQEQTREFNPCEACRRWDECNGVDSDNCPLWRDDK